MPKQDWCERLAGRTRSGSHTGKNLMDVITALKQLPPRNPDGAGAKPIRTIAVDIPVAKAARDVAETYGVTIGALATFAIQRLLADLKTEQSKTVVVVREAIELAFTPS